VAVLLSRCQSPQPLLPCANSSPTYVNACCSACFINKRVEIFSRDPSWSAPSRDKAAGRPPSCAGFVIQVRRETRCWSVGSLPSHVGATAAVRLLCQSSQRTISPFSHLDTRAQERHGQCYPIEPLPEPIRSDPSAKKISARLLIPTRIRRACRHQIEWAGP